MIDSYDWARGREAMLRFGPANGPRVVFAAALFEEANRTRAFLVTLLRALADHGVTSFLPDLPGTGESLTQLEEINSSCWVNAFSSVASGPPCHVAGMRGGCLVAGNAPAVSRWYFAPSTGDAVVRELVRARQLAEIEDPRGFDPDDIERDGPPIELAGNLVARSLLRALRDSEADRMAPCRVVRLETDPREADLKVAGSPLWRRSEPDNEPALAEQLAADLATWVRQCAS